MRFLDHKNIGIAISFMRHLLPKLLYKMGCSVMVAIILLCICVIVHIGAFKNNLLTLVYYFHHL